MLTNKDLVKWLFPAPKEEKISDEKKKEKEHIIELCSSLPYYLSAYYSTSFIRESYAGDIKTFLRITDMMTSLEIIVGAWFEDKYDTCVDIVVKEMKKCKCGYSYKDLERLREIMKKLKPGNFYDLNERRKDVLDLLKYAKEYYKFKNQQEVYNALENLEKQLRRSEE